MCYHHSPVILTFYVGTTHNDLGEITEAVRWDDIDGVPSKRYVILRLHEEQL